MKKVTLIIFSLFMYLTAESQTFNVKSGNLIYQFPASSVGEMTYSGGTTLAIMGKTFSLSELSKMYVDESKVTDNTVSVIYESDGATVYIAGNIAEYVEAIVSGGHVTITQSSDVSDDTCGEITYTLSGSCNDGEFLLNGSYKSTVELDGLTLTNPNGAAINIQDGKRIDISIKKDTENTLKDSSSSDAKGCMIVKGHGEFKGHGTLDVYSYGSSAHGIKVGEYMTVKNCTINVVSASKDGIHCTEYFLMESGNVSISGTGDDCIQSELDGTTSTGTLQDHDGEDSGSIYILGGNMTLTPTGDAVKGLKADGDIEISDGVITITQTGSLVTSETDISYPTSIKSDGDIRITGGTITITNTADGGKGISAEGTLSIDESNATTTINVKTNGIGGTAENVSSGGTEETEKSYKVYISLPTSGGGGGWGGPGGGGSNAWKNPVLYNSDGTLITSLTKTITKTSGNTTTTFYYHDFKDADTNVTYYVKGDDYNSRGTTYTIVTETFSAPTSGSDIYYSISSSYTINGSTRTYKLSNVTNTYSGSTDASEENGTAYNAIGLKSDGNMTISAGQIDIRNSGLMSKSIKTKKNLYVNGGTITLTPSGNMQVVNNDANYCSGIKCDDFEQNGGSLTITVSGNAGRGISSDNITTNGGTLTITNSGAGVSGTNDSYTSKCLKADNSIALNAGTITLKSTGTGGKGIKTSGTYSQGTSDGNGPKLSVTTTGSSIGGTGGGGGGWGPPGGQSSGGSSSKAIKVMGTAVLYGGETEIYTSTDGAEGLESKTSIDVRGGNHYFKCYDDCINSSGSITFNGGVTVCYSNGNDAIDSNYGRSGAITIGNGVVFAYTTKGSPEEGFDCDNNSYIKISGTGIGISAGGAQGGGSSSSSISGAAQGYAFYTSNVSYSSGRYYTLSDGSGNNLVTYSFPASINSTLSLITATGMKSGSTYYVKYSTTAPTDAKTAFNGIYLGSSASGTNSVFSFTAK